MGLWSARRRQVLVGCPVCSPRIRPHIRPLWSPGTLHIAGKPAVVVVVFRFGVGLGTFGCAGGVGVVGCVVAGVVLVGVAPVVCAFRVEHGELV